MSSSSLLSVLSLVFSTMPIATKPKCQSVQSNHRKGQVELVTTTVDSKVAPCFTNTHTQQDGHSTKLTFGFGSFTRSVYLHISIEIHPYMHACIHPDTHTFIVPCKTKRKSGHESTAIHVQKQAWACIMSYKNGTQSQCAWEKLRYWDRH